MDEKTDYYLGAVIKNDVGASEASINRLQEQVGFELPNDYADYMKEYNGGEGEVGKNGWLCLFPIEDLFTTNMDYSLLMEQIPDYFLFGKDAADTGYAFHKFNRTFHSFGLMSDFRTDPMEFCGRSFGEFVEYLYKQ
jgi:hypothetical protein